jgi:hypothetical protein
VVLVVEVAAAQLAVVALRVPRQASVLFRRLAVALVLTVREAIWLSRLTVLPVAVAGCMPPDTTARLSHQDRATTVASGFQMVLLMETLAAVVVLVRLEATRQLPRAGTVALAAHRP